MSDTLISSDAGWPEPALLEDEAIPTAVVRHDGVTVADLHELFDSTYSKVALALGAQSNPPAGPAIAVYEGDVASTFSIEIGFPVDTPLADPQDDIVGSELPPGPLAVLTHIGPYDRLPDAWASLMGWLSTEGHTPGRRFGEIYVSEPGPDADPEQLRTDLFVALA